LSTYTAYGITLFSIAPRNCLPIPFTFSMICAACFAYFLYTLRCNKPRCRCGKACSEHHEPSRESRVFAGVAVAPRLLFAVPSCAPSPSSRRSWEDHCRTRLCPPRYNPLLHGSSQLLAHPSDVQEDMSACFAYIYTLRCNKSRRGSALPPPLFRMMQTLETCSQGIAYSDYRYVGR
jgi:hypothetical protein